MKCEACGRALKKFTVSNTAPDGEVYGWGPVCAKEVTVRKARAVKREAPWRRGRTVVPSRDVRQVDWVNEQQVSQHL